MSRGESHYDYYQVDKFTDLKDMIAKSAHKYANNIAFVYQDKIEDQPQKITYREYEIEISQAASGLVDLLDLDLTKKDGEKFALLSPNCYHWTLAYFSVVNLNQVIVPMDWQLPVRDLVNLITRSGAKTIFYSSIIDDKIKELKALLPQVKHYISLDESQQSTKTMNDLKKIGAAKLAKQPNFYQKLKIFPETMCTLLFTSGTTSTPKGVMLNHSNIANNTMDVCRLLDFDQEKHLPILPLYHCMEVTLGLFSQVARGSTIYYLPGGLPNFAQNLQIAKPTMLILVPLIVEKSYTLIRDSLSDKNDFKAFQKAAKAYFGGHLKKVIAGGAPVNPAISAEYGKLGIKILQGYGITENSAAVALNRDHDSKYQAAGLPLPNIKVKIDQPDEEGVGEVIISGHSVMMGYYKDKKKTDEAVIDGWLRTGDYGYLDQDGFLYISGRKKNVIIGKNAKNVYPEELENQLKNTLGISEAMVFGKLIEGDSKPAALIVIDCRELRELKPDLSANPSQKEVEKIIGQQIKKINQENPKYKHILFFEITDHIPKTATGKIKRS